MDGDITKAEHFREHAEFLRATARCLRRDDKNRATLLDMAYHFEDLAKVGENGTRKSSANENRLKKEALPLVRGPREAA